MSLHCMENNSAIISVQLYVALQTDFKFKCSKHNERQNWNALASALNCYQFGKH